MGALYCDILQVGICQLRTLPVPSFLGVLSRAVPVLGYGLTVEPQAPSYRLFGQSHVTQFSYLHDFPHFRQACSPLESVHWLESPIQFEWVSLSLSSSGHSWGIFVAIYVHSKLAANTLFSSCLQDFPIVGRSDRVNGCEM